MKAIRMQVEEVLELGERIGYGNMMDIAGALWALKLKKQGIIDLPPVLAITSSRADKHAINSHKNMLAIIEELDI